MILIMDNGGDYELHRLDFIDCADMDPDEVVVLYCMLQEPGCAYEVARMDTCTFKRNIVRTPEQMMSITTYWLGDAVMKADLTQFSDRAFDLIVGPDSGAEYADEEIFEKLQDERARRSRLEMQ